MKGTFSITESIRFGWDKLGKNILPFLVMYGIMVGVSGVISLVDMMGSFLSLVPALIVPGILARVIGQLLSYLATLLMTAGMLKMALKMYNNEKFEILDCVKAMYMNYKYLLNMFLASLLYLAFSLILLLLFVLVLGVTMLSQYFTTDVSAWFGAKAMFEALPGDPALIAILIGTALLYICINIFVGTRVAFYTYFIVDKEAGPIEAYRKSLELTSGNFWKLFGFWFVLGAVFFAGLLVCCIGIVAAIPIVMMAQVFAYKKLAGEEPLQQEASAVTLQPPAAQ